MCARCHDLFAFVMFVHCLQPVRGYGGHDGHGEYSGGVGGNDAHGVA